MPGSQALGKKETISEKKKQSQKNFKWALLNTLKPVKPRRIEPKKAEYPLRK